MGAELEASVETVAFVKDDLANSKEEASITETLENTVAKYATSGMSRATSEETSAFAISEDMVNAKAVKSDIDEGIEEFKIAFTSRDNEPVVDSISDKVKSNYALPIIAGADKQVAVAATGPTEAEKQIDKELAVLEIKM